MIVTFPTDVHQALSDRYMASAEQNGVSSNDETDHSARGSVMPQYQSITTTLTRSRSLQTRARDSRRRRKGCHQDGMVQLLSLGVLYVAKRNHTSIV